MVLNPHTLGVHKILKHIPLNAIFDAPSKRRLAKAVNIADLRLCAKQRAHKMVFDYLDAGADDEITIRRQKDAYTEIDMHYHILAGIKPPLDLSTKIFGQDVSLPFFGCPTAGNRMFHWEGEAAAARAAAHHGTLYGLSSLATTGITEVGQIYDGPKVFQLYVWKDRELVKEVLAKAKEGGFHAMALTVDFTWYGNRERDIRNDFSIPPKYSLNQVIKAKETGFTTMWVSNHGGRQLDTSPATIDVLESIREAVGPDTEIILDGGVQRGTDIAKALALGADAVGVGKPYLYGLAAGGTDGIIKAYDILKVELDRAMGLLGTGTVDDLKKRGPGLVKRRAGSARDYPDRYAYERGYGGGII